MNPGTELNPGDVVQLSPDECGNPMLAAAFMVVTEVRSWGAVGYVQALGKNGKRGGLAYYRAKWAEMEHVGKAEWIVGEDS